MGLAAAVVGAGVIGAVGSVVAAGTAAGAQEDAANTAANTQLNMYNQTRSDLAPYNLGGQSAFNNLSSLIGTNGAPNSAAMMSALQNYPGYQFTLGQGMQALDRSEAAKGQLLSGGQLKDLSGYAQGQASTLFNNYWNQNMGMAQLGESAASQTGNAGTAAAQGAASSQMAGGSAAASGIMGMNNAFQGGLNSAIQGYALNQAINYAPYTGGGVDVTPSAFAPYSGGDVAVTPSVFGGV
jgi:hypothetical protein